MPFLSPPDPRDGLDDGVVALRPFEWADLPAFEAALLPGGNEGIWLILVEGDARRSLAEHVDGWSGGAPVGANLAVASSAGGPPLGVVYLTPRGAESVELTYGVAPANRGCGVATRAARLAARWLIQDRGWRQVELRISDDHPASQRVALKAGFRPAGRVRTKVPSAGREFDDRLFITTAEGP